MKNVFAIFCIVLLSITTLRAQDFSKPVVLIKLGPAIPLGDNGFKDVHILGPELGLAFEKKVRNSFFVTLDFSYSSFRLSKRDLLKSLNLDEDKYFVDGGGRSFFNLQASLKRKFFLYEKFVPYVFGGIGAYRQLYGETRIVFGKQFFQRFSDEYVSGISSVGGFGLEFPLQKEFFKFLVEVSYFSTIKDTKTSYFPIKIGIAFFN